MKANKKNKIKVTSRAGRKEERTAYLCLIPAFLGVSLISYLPTLAVFVLSVFKWNGLSSPEFVGLENFQRIFTKDIYFADSIKATILYALLAVVGAIIYSLLVALLLNMKIWGRTLFRSVFFIPYLLPAIGVYKGWQWLYEGNFGLFNFVLRMVGLKPQRFLDSPSQVVPSLVVIAIWTSGNLIVVFLAGLQNVPRVYMAALLERYHSKHFPDYFLQRADCPDHTPAGYQPGAGSYRWRPRKKVHVYVLCYLSLCI